MSWIAAIPHLEPYGDPIYFLYVLVAVLPIFVGLWYQKRWPVYEMCVNVVFITTMLVGTKTPQLLAFLGYVIWQLVVVFLYQAYLKKANQTGIFVLFVLLSILPLTLVKVEPLWMSPGRSLFGFMGISYLTFKTTAMVMEMRDGLITSVGFWDYLRFLLFMPTISSGPIDRYRRFQSELHQLPDRERLMTLFEKAIWSIMLGFFYKFIIAYFLGQELLPPLKDMALSRGGFFNLPTLGVMYVYGLDLFFDFAGYSLFALAISYLMGVETPRNFDQPFLSQDLKEFWNRWHMSLSFWFRDFVFMRLVKNLVKKKVFANRNTTSNVAYTVNMLIMGLWHGLTWYYVAYGLFHGLGLVLNDMWLRKKKTINRKRKEEGRSPLPENRWTQWGGIMLTFHVVMFSFLIFSGFLDQLWFR